MALTPRMSRKTIEIIDIKVLKGPSMWTYRPVLEAWVDIGDFEILGMTSCLFFKSVDFDSEVEGLGLGKASSTGKPIEIVDSL